MDLSWEAYSLLIKKFQLLYLPIGNLHVRVIMGNVIPYLCTVSQVVCSHYRNKLLLLEALQLQRSFCLLNKCLPFGPISDAVLICYFSLIP